MRISRIKIAIVCALVASAGAIAGTMPFSSAKEALKQGISAYRGGYYEIAIPALEHAAAANEFLGQYYLARIYADNAGTHTDHVKAYMLLQKIVDEYAEVDPDDDPRAPYVGKSLTALAGYVREGLPEIGLRADLDRAIEYLHNASVIFNDEDAQFELAKLQLKGEGVEENVPKAKHWLSVLTQRGHAGAQAFLADLLWRGKFMEPDQPRALALITIAMRNAPQHERLWIEDIYQNIFCGSGEGIRKQASGIVAGWGGRYGRPPSQNDRAERLDLGQLAGGPVRTCQNGEPVSPVIEPDDKQGSGSAAGMPAAAEAKAARTTGFVYGTAGAGPELRDIGAPAPDDANRGDR